jgi:hypothetical protein
MTTKTTRPRDYRSDRHLATVLQAPNGGVIALRPLRADNIYFDIAKADSMPANERTTRNGSEVLNIGGGVEIRASGNAKLVGTYQGDDQWAVEGTLYASQYPSGRELTRKQADRARALIGELITTWARAHAGDIAQADDIDRNNGARTLEEAIARHEEALRILRAQLSACEEGEPFTQYPDLPTRGR